MSRAPTQVGSAGELNQSHSRLGYAGGAIDYLYTEPTITEGCPYHADGQVGPASAKMAHHIRQHTVAQVLLRRFTDGAGRLFGFDKSTLKEYPTSPRDAAQERNFYDLPGKSSSGRMIDPKAVEKALGRLETKFGQILPEFLAAADCGSVTHDQIAEFSPFVVLQWMRTKAYRISIDQIGRQLAEQLTRRVEEAGAVPEDFRAMAAADKLSVLHAAQMFQPEKIARYARELDKHLWIIGVNNELQPFYTSDHPVVRRANKFDGDTPLVGINDPGIEYAFPLSSKHILLILERSHFAKWRRYDGKARVLSSDEVADYNRLQVMRCSQRLYCATALFDLARQVCAEDPKVRDPNRQLVRVDASPIQDMTNHVVATALE